MAGEDTGTKDPFGDLELPSMKAGGLHRFRDGSDRLLAIHGAEPGAAGAGLRARERRMSGKRFGGKFSAGGPSGSVQAPAALQASQAPPQDASQQTPSQHSPPAHSNPSSQASPTLFSAWHVSSENWQ